MMTRKIMQLPFKSKGRSGQLITCVLSMYCRHPRAGGDPGSGMKRLGSRLRGDDR
jgi:hypothetical protein